MGTNVLVNEVVRHLFIFIPFLIFRHYFYVHQLIWKRTQGRWRACPVEQTMVPVVIVKESVVCCMMAIGRVLEGSRIEIIL